MTEPVKCFLCAVPLTHSAHEAIDGGRRCHCTCLVRSQRGTIEVLEKRVDELKAAVRWAEDEMRSRQWPQTADRLLSKAGLAP